LARRRHLRQRDGEQPLEQPAAAKEDAERLVEQDGMFVALHEHGMKRPVKILARAHARRLHGGERVEHRAGPHRNAGHAQRPREVENVFGEAARSIAGCRGHSAAIASISSNHFSSKIPVMITVDAICLDPSTSWRMRRLSSPYRRSDKNWVTLIR